MATGGRMTPGTNVGMAQYTVAEIRAAVDEARRARVTQAAHAHSRAAYLKADNDFHITIAQATNNDALVGLLRTLCELIQATLRVSPAPSQEGARQHTSIYQAIASRDPAAACQAIFEHLHETEQRTRRLMDGEL
jgi:DNA-binding FadR family transcriptional regulator